MFFVKGPSRSSECRVSDVFAVAQWPPLAAAIASYAIPTHSRDCNDPQSWQVRWGAVVRDRNEGEMLVGNGVPRYPICYPMEVT